MTQRFIYSAILATTLLLSSALKPQLVEPTLKEAYKNFFPIGVAVEPRNLVGPEAELSLRQFNSLTAENAMKMGPIPLSTLRKNMG